MKHSMIVEKNGFYWFLTAALPDHSARGIWHSCVMNMIRFQIAIQKY